MRYKKTSLHQVLQTHTVILLNKETKEIGTGVLIQHGSWYMVLTAEHILNDTHPDLLLIHLGISGQRYPMKKERIWRDTSRDLAYIQLNSFEVQTFINRLLPIKLGSERARDTAREQLRCAVCGYPDSMAYFDESTQTKMAESILITTIAIPSEKWPVGIRENGKDPASNFILTYGSKQGGRFRNQEGEEITPPSPYGLSGAGVWVYDPKTEDNERPDYALFGVQTGIYVKEQVLVGSFVKPLLDRIREDFPIGGGDSNQIVEEA